MLIAILLAGCSGAGRTATPLAPATATGLSTARFVITVPPRTTQSTKRAPAYISAATQSITIDIKPHGSGTSVSGFPMTANLTSSSAGCSTVLAATQCAIQVAVPVGMLDGTFTTYDNTGGTGNVLSATQGMVITVAEGQPNVIPLVLGGVPSTLAIAVASGSLSGEPDLGFTVLASSSGTLSAFGVDAAGNTIIGAGAPAITAASNTAQLQLVQPGTSTPNALTVTATATTAIGQITVTATPVSGTGTAAISRTFTVQTPNYPRIYVSDYDSPVHVYDASGRALSAPGGFPGSAYASGIAYDSANGLLYVSTQNGSSSTLLAYDQRGYPQPIATVSLTTSFGVIYDPANAQLYLPGTSVASSYDAAGVAHSLTSAIPGGYDGAYNPLNNELYAGSGRYTPSGTTVATGFGSISGGVFAFNAFNGLMYVGSDYPTAVTAYDSSNNQVALSGPFTLHTVTDQIFGMGADPITGNIYLAINTHYLAGFDKDGNALGAPWNEVPNGLADANGVAVVPPR
jgi:hypothetical protein